MTSVVAVVIVIAIVVLGEYTKTRGRFLLTALVVRYISSVAWDRPGWQSGGPIRECGNQH